jgi:hypothetical protein
MILAPAHCGAHVGIAIQRCRPLNAQQWEPWTRISVDECRDVDCIDDA